MPTSGSKKLRKVRKRKTSKVPNTSKPVKAVRGVNLQRNRRVNLSQNELKYQRLYEKHQKLLIRHKKYKQTHDRKITLLRNQLKHTLHFVGVKVQSLETRLLWYQKQWKNQQSQFTKKQLDRNQNQRNKCIQTDWKDTVSTDSKSKSIPSRRMRTVKTIKSKKVAVKDSSHKLSPSVLDSDLHSDLPSNLTDSPISMNHKSKYQIIIPTPPIVHSECTPSTFSMNLDFKSSRKSISNEFRDESQSESHCKSTVSPIISTDSTPSKSSSNVPSNGLDLSFLSRPMTHKSMTSPNMLSNEALKYMPDDAMAKHNQLITRLRARLDTMSDILISTKDKLHAEFDDMSLPPSVDLSNLNLSCIGHHVDMRKVYDESSEFNGKNALNISSNGPSCGPLPETESVSPTTASATTVTSPSPKKEDSKEHSKKQIDTLSNDVSDMSVSGMSSPLTSDLISSQQMDLEVDTASKDIESTYSFLEEYDDDASDFRSVISRVTANMAKLGRNLKTMSSVSSPCSDTESDPNPDE